MKKNINVPFTSAQVQNLSPGFNITAEFPNRRMRRYKYNSVPNSSKMAKCSSQSSVVFRTKKYASKLSNSFRPTN